MVRLFILFFVLGGVLITHSKLNNGIKDGDEICSTNIARGFDNRWFQNLDTVYTNTSIFPENRSFSQIAELTIAGQSGDSVLYHHLLNKWIDLFGLSDYATRFLSFLFYLSALVIFFLLLKELKLTTELGLLGMALLSLHPLISDYAVETRSYMMALCLTLLTTFYFVQLIWKNHYGYQNIVLFGVLAGLMLITHYLTFYALIAFTIAATFTVRNKLHWTKLFVSTLIACSILGSWLFIFDGTHGFEMMGRVSQWWKELVTTSHKYAYPATPYFVVKSLGAIAGTFAGLNFYKLIPNWFYFSLTAIWMCLLTYYFFKSRKNWDKQSTWLALHLIVPIVILTAMAFNSGHTVSLSRRYFNFAIPFAIILLLKHLSYSSKFEKFLLLATLTSPILFSSLIIPKGNPEDNFYMNRLPNHSVEIEKRWTEHHQNNELLVFGNVDDAILFNNYANSNLEIHQLIDPQIGLDKVVLRNQKSGREELLFDFSKTDNREQTRYFW